MGSARLSWAGEGSWAKPDASKKVEDECKRLGIDVDLIALADEEAKQEAIELGKKVSGLMLAASEPGVAFLALLIALEGTSEASDIPFFDLLKVYEVIHRQYELDQKN